MEDKGSTFTLYMPTFWDRIFCKIQILWFFVAAAWIQFPFILIELGYPKYFLIFFAAYIPILFWAIPLMIESIRYHKRLIEYKELINSI